MYIGQERQWKNDTNNEHFIILAIDLYDNCKIEYLTNGRIHIKSSDEIEKESIECENSSFKYDDCNNILQFESGKEWLYNNRCRICEHKLKCQYL